MLGAGADTLSLELLGVPVVVRCDDPEHAERMRVCYRRSLVEVESCDVDAPVEAALSRAADGWEVRVSGRDPVRADDWTIAVRLLNHELLHGVMLRARELYYVHASVVELDGRGIVMPGLSLAGKSTLALAFVLRGARYLSDELLAFDPAAGVARAFPRAMKVRDVCALYFPGLQFVGEGEARFLPFDAPAPHTVDVAATCAIDAVVLPRWGGLDCETTLEEVSPGRALLDLASSSLNFGAHREASIDRLTELVGRARAYRLTWREPHEAARLVAEALEG